MSEPRMDQPEPGTPGRPVSEKVAQLRTFGDDLMWLFMEQTKLREGPLRMDENTPEELRPMLHEALGILAGIQMRLVIMGQEMGAAALVEEAGMPWDTPLDVVADWHEERGHAADADHLRSADGQLRSLGGRRGALPEKLAKEHGHDEG